jgi:hypothetical protein
MCEDFYVGVSVWSWVSIHDTSSSPCLCFISVYLTNNKKDVRLSERADRVEVITKTFLWM